MLSFLKNKNLYIHLLGWLVFIALIGLLFFLQNGHIPTIILLKIGFGVSLFYINYYLLIPSLLFKRKFILYIISIIALITITTLFYTYTKASLFYTAYPDSSHHVHYKHYTSSKFMLSIFIYMILILMGIAVKVLNYWNKDEKRKLKISSNKTQSELQNLKNQINPHFLFNSLNSIYALTLKKSDKSPDAVMMLSDLMRYMLYETDIEYVSLEKEIAYIKNYIALQKLQIANSDTIQLTINGNSHNQRISPLILISFIENAFKFGTDFSGKTKIDIDITIKQEELYFSCKNIIGNTSEASNKEYGGIGIKNTKERLKLSYPDKHWLTIDKDNHTYFVTLLLKLT